MSVELNKYNLDNYKYTAYEKIIFKSFQNVIENISNKMENTFSMHFSEIKQLIKNENNSNYIKHNIDSSNIVNFEEILICLKSYMKYKIIGCFIVDNIQPLSCESSKLENIYNDEFKVDDDLFDYATTTKHKKY